MKLIKTYILLLLITMNVFVSSVRITQSRRKNLKNIVDKIKNFFRGDNVKKVFDTIKSFFMNKENLKNIEIFVTFILGIASKWFESIEPLYKKFKEIKDGVKNFITLITKCNPSWEPAKKQFLMVEEEDKSNENSDITICQRQSEFYTKKQKAQDDEVKKYGTIFQWGSDICDNRPSEFFGKGIEEDKAINEYKENCKFFKNRNCEKNKPNDYDKMSIISYLIVKTKSYFKSIKTHFETINECGKAFDGLFDQTFFKDIKDTIKVLGGQVAKEIASVVMKSSLGPYLQFFTAGVWGGIKGAYQFFKLSKTIYEVAKFLDGQKNDIKDLKDQLLDNAFKIGRIIGDVIKTIVALVTGSK